MSHRRPLVAPVLVALLPVLLSSASASAQAQPQPQPAAAEPDPALASQQSPAPAVSEPADPTGDRAFISPTALTMPKGTVTVSDYMLLVAGVTYAPLDRLQLTGTVVLPTLWPRADHDGPVFSLNLKGQILQLWRLRVALVGGFDGLGRDEIASESRRESFLEALEPRVGAVLSFCLSADCESLITTSVHTVWEEELAANDGDNPGVVGSASIMVGGRGRKFIAELNTSVQLDRSRSHGTGPEDDHDSGFGIGFLGIRWYGRRYAIDTAVMAFAAGQGGGILPFVSGTWRF